MSGVSPVSAFTSKGQKALGVVVTGSATDSPVSGTGAKGVHGIASVMVSDLDGGVNAGCGVRVSPGRHTHNNGNSHKSGRHSEKVSPVHFRYLFKANDFLHTLNFDALKYFGL